MLQLENDQREDLTEESLWGYDARHDLQIVVFNNYGFLVQSDLSVYDKIGPVKVQPILTGCMDDHADALLPS